MDNANSSNWSIPWPALAALLVAAGGMLFYFSPLNSDRPTFLMNSTQAPLGYQDCDARLWQDPFKAINDSIAGAQMTGIQTKTGQALAPTTNPSLQIQESVEPASFDHPSGPKHSLCEIQKQIYDDVGGNAKVRVLGVMVDAGPYSEQAEQRLRARAAVLEALATCGFGPADGQHIGYCSLKWPWESFSRSRDLENEYKTAEPTNDTLRTLNVPYEWCLLDKSSPEQTTDVSKVLILWIDENYFADVPLTRLSLLFGAIEGSHIGPNGTENTHEARNITNEVIGPRTSTTLRSMILEYNFHLSPTIAASLQSLKIFGACPTADDERLLAGLSVTPGTSVSQFFGQPLNIDKKSEAITFIRTTINDRKLCGSLVDELTQRGVNFGWDPSKEPDSDFDPFKLPQKDESGPDHIALVSEWDTYYGRCLPVSFAMAAIPPSQVEKVIAGEFPYWIYPFWYLRGIDGQTAQADARKISSLQPAEPKANEAKSLKFESTSERPEGMNGSDYLRRLADQLSLLDRRLNSDTGHGIRAVGVLGSDPYDKLLVIEALRDRLPRTLFFTTEIDARYSLSSEWATTHNLLIASSFGQMLHPWYQQNIPPFRDSYQTAFFATTLAAMDRLGNRDKPLVTPDQIEKQFHSESPRFFEIGRRGAFDLTNESKDDELLPSDSTRDVDLYSIDHLRPPLQGGAAPLSLNPPRYDLEYWWVPRRLKSLVVAALLLAILIATGLLFGVRPHKAGVRPIVLKLFTQTVPFMVIATPICLAMVYGLAWLSGHNGEPFAWFQGMSIWPTEFFRLLVIALSTHYLIKSSADVIENDRDIQTEFLLFPLSFAALGYPFTTSGQSQLPPPDQDVDALKHDPSWKISLSGWRVYGKQVKFADYAKDPPYAQPAPRTSIVGAQPHLTQKICAWFFGSEEDRNNPLPDADFRVYAQNLWWEYLERSRKRRYLRVIIWAALYFTIGYIIMRILGQPQWRGRGLFAQRVDETITLISVAASIILTFFVLDATYLNKRFIEYLIKTPTQWPFGVFTKYGSWKLGLDLTEYLDIRLIAMRTRVVGEFIYYPFVIFFLMVVSRNSLFDDWDWPAALIIVLSANVSLAIIGALMLRYAAEEARRHAMKEIHERRIGYIAQGNQFFADALGKLFKDVRNERGGAFSILSQHPFLAAIVLPSSGIGLWAVLEYLAKSLS